MQEVVQQEAAWLLTQQLPGGAVFTAYPGQPKIVPYFANLAFYGLAAWGCYLDRVRDYLDWYLGHLEVPDRYGIKGSIYDYLIDASGVEVSTFSYDSSDAYGATFLTLVRLYYEASSDIAWLNDHRQELELVAGAVLATMQRDGLTLARPDWRVKYLMDNCEVYRGLSDYAWLLASGWQDRGKATCFESLAQRVKGALETKMRVNGAYCPAIYRFGIRKRPNWKRWYPDAMAQLFPIINGVLEPGEEVVRRLYANFMRNYSHWYRQSGPQQFTTTLVAYAAALVEDRWRLRQYVTDLQRHILDRGHPWPYHAAEAGILMLALRHYLRD